MNCIEHVLEPRRLFLYWQRPLDENLPRPRRLVAEVVSRDDGSVVFRYLVNSVEFENAKEEGFKGFPAFGLATDPEHREGVLAALLRRLPPRNRDDFPQFLAKHRLPTNFSGSDMALLGYTGAKLPGDGFELALDLNGVKPPMELVIEVAGFRFQNISREVLALGDSVELIPEPENPADPNAVAIEHAQGRIGYVSKPYCGALRQWLGLRSVTATIERINGKPERPLIYLFVRIS